MTEPRRRAALILALYGQQGLVAGFLTAAVPNFFVAGGATAGEVGAFLAAVGLPWIVQPLWGPVVDGAGRWRMGARRFWVVAAACGTLSALLLMSAAAPERLDRLIPLVLLHGAFASLSDTATDAWLIAHVPPGARGGATALTRVGFVGGMAVSAAVTGALLPRLGFGGVALLLAATGLLAALVPLALREEPGDARLSLRRAGPAGMSFRLPLARGDGPFLLFCLTMEAAGALLRVPLAVDLVRSGGWPAAQLSAFQGALLFGSGTAGAVLAGWLADRAGAGRALATLLGAAALAHALAALGLTTGAATLATTGVTSAMAFVALAPLAMRDAEGPASATRFALFMAALNGGEVLGSRLSPWLAEALGLPGAALLAAFLLGALAASARFLAKE